MDKINDIIGNTYGRLTVLSYDHSDGYMKYYLCKCSCGNTKVVLRNNLFAGYTKSCGCLQKEQASKAHNFPDEYRPIRSIFYNMKNRCYDPNNNRYYRYGARGITICDEWLNDKYAFCRWALENGYAPGLTIDRIDNNGNYCPENCRWSTPKEQMHNFSNNVPITYNGETKTLSEWADSLNIKRTTLHNRLRYYHWSVEKALTTPVRNH